VGDVTEILVEALPESESIAHEVLTETATPNGSEAAETGHAPDPNTPGEKKEFDTIENSEGVR
jgi:hypothetical protein